MLAHIHPCGLAAASFILGAVSLAQNAPNNRRYLDNGGDVVFSYSDPSVGTSAGSGTIDTSGDLWWIVYPRQSMVSATGTAALSGLTFDLFDTDWSTPATYFDVLFGPGAHANPSDPNNITPDFSAAGFGASTLLFGGPSGLPNPCTVSPGFCSSIGGGALCPPAGTLVGYTVHFTLGDCQTSGLVLSANDTVDNVITAFVPGGMWLTSGPPGACGSGDYALMSATSTNETQADTGTPGASRYGGFQFGAAPGFIPDAVTERMAFGAEFCDSQVNTTWSGDRGTVGLHVDATLGTSLRQTVHDRAGLGATQLCFVTNSVLAPLPAPGISLFGAGVLLNLADITVTATLKHGPVIPDPLQPYPFGQAVFKPTVAIQLATTASFDLCSQALTVDLATFSARGSPLTSCGINK